MNIFFILILGSYFFLLLCLIIGWRKSTALTSTQVDHYNFISIVISFRNEVDHINQLIESLNEIEYPAGSCEVILVDDHSTDQSVARLKSLQHSINVKILTSAGKGKKSALTTGINNALGEIIVTTDADCQQPPGWLNSINETFQDPDVQLAFGAVLLKPNNSLFSKMQSIEFASLIGSAAATIGYGILTMCNGANLAFRKSAFERVGGYEGNENIPSGDDEFLARKIDKAFPGSIKFLSNKQGVVMTAPLNSLKDFVWQRLRWAGKWKYNTSVVVRLLSLFIIILQFSFLALCILLIAGKAVPYMAFSLLAIKIFLEAIFLFDIVRFVGSRWNWMAFLFLQFVYPVYVIGIGVASFWSGFEWKGRRLNNKM